MYWHAIRETFRVLPRFYLSFNLFHFNLKVKWYLKPILGIYTAWYFLIMTAILFTLATLYIPAWLVYLIPPVRRLWPNPEFGAQLPEELDEFPPPRLENLNLARVIISYTEKSELEEIVTQALAEQPLEQLKRMKEIIMNGG